MVQSSSVPPMNPGDRQVYWELLRNSSLGIAATLTVYLISISQMAAADAKVVDFALIIDTKDDNRFFYLLALYILTRLSAIGIPLAGYGALACEGRIIEFKGVPAKVEIALNNIAGTIVVLAGIILVVATWAFIYLVSPASGWCFAFATLVIFAFFVFLLFRFRAASGT